MTKPQEEKIGGYINSGGKGKRIAFMIRVLRGLGYVPKTTTDHRSENQFNTDIGCEKHHV